MFTNDKGPRAGDSEAFSEKLGGGSHYLHSANRFAPQFKLPGSPDAVLIWRADRRRGRNTAAVLYVAAVTAAGEKVGAFHPCLDIADARSVAVLIAARLGGLPIIDRSLNKRQRRQLRRQGGI